MINKGLLTLLLSMTALQAMEDLSSGRREELPLRNMSISSLLNPISEEEEGALASDWQVVESIEGTIDSFLSLQSASFLPQAQDYELFAATQPEAGQKRKHDATTLILDEEEEIASDSNISSYQNVDSNLFSKTYYLNLIQSFDLQETKKKKEILNLFYKNLLGIINLEPKVEEHFLKEIALWKSMNVGQAGGRKALDAFVDALTSKYQLSVIKDRCRRAKVGKTQLDSQSQEILVEIGRVAAAILSHRQSESTEQRSAKRPRSVTRGSKLTLKQEFMEDIINMVTIEECESLLNDICDGNRKKLEELIHKIQEKYCDAEKAPLKLKTLSGRLRREHIESKFPHHIAWIRDADNKAVIEANYKSLLRLIGSHSSALSLRQAS
ncbi:hypothetical protein [Candidatus Odyssella thessalonicensis]|uniref:hypothetical protein n=1 Tax=Candidatus Odyssella thessalonicensis TaxID=84647 RepID=UPI000225A9B4|nr:hypothetical protein [Candidatus Odyssella thessalonicensis]